MGKCNFGEIIELYDGSDGSYRRIGAKVALLCGEPASPDNVGRYKIKHMLRRVGKNLSAIRWQKPQPNTICMRPNQVRTQPDYGLHNPWDELLWKG